MTGKQATLISDPRSEEKGGQGDRGKEGTGPQRRGGDRGTNKNKHYWIGSRTGEDMSGQPGRVQMMPAV